jgi:hypothetical protein
VIADWPGLKAADLLENRDLKPTIDVRAVLKGLLKDHLRASDHALAADVFPGSDDLKPIAGLVASSGPQRVEAVLQGGRNAQEQLCCSRMFRASH